MFQDGEPVAAGGLQGEPVEQAAVSLQVDRADGGEHFPVALEETGVGEPLPGLAFLRVGEGDPDFVDFVRAEE